MLIAIKSEEEFGRMCLHPRILGRMADRGHAIAKRLMNDEAELEFFGDAEHFYPDDYKIERTDPALIEAIKFFGDLGAIVLDIPDHTKWAVFESDKGEMVIDLAHSWGRSANVLEKLPQAA